MLDLNLQLFADGGDGGAGAGGLSAGAPTTGSENTGVKEDAADLIRDYRQKRNQGKYGSKQAVAKAPPTTTAAQPQEAQRVANAEAQTQQPAPDPEDRQAKFQALKDGEFKPEFDAWAQETIQQRLRSAKDAEATLEKLKPAIEALAQKHGLEATDLDGLVKTITDDDALYEEEALQRGIPIEALKEMKALQRDSQEYQRIKEEQIQRRMMDEHFRKVVQQAEEAKKFYPGLDLRAEMQNPAFAQLVANNVDVRTAYEVVNRDRIMPQMMAAVAQRTEQRVSSAVQAGARRVPENGLSPSGGAVTLSDNPKNWSRKQREAIAERAKRERVVLR